MRHSSDQTTRQRYHSLSNISWQYKTTWWNQYIAAAYALPGLWKILASLKHNDGIRLEKLWLFIIGFRWPSTLSLHYHAQIAYDWEKHVSDPPAQSLKCQMIWIRSRMWLVEPYNNNHGLYLGQISNNQNYYFWELFMLNAWLLTCHTRVFNAHSTWLCAAFYHPAYHTEAEDSWKEHTIMQVNAQSQTWRRL